MGDDHTLPDELTSLLGAIQRFTGDLGDAAEVDWMEQTVTVIGQVGQTPDAYEEGQIDAMVEVMDGNIEGLLDEHYEGEVINRETTDGGFRYVLDVSMYDLPRESKQTRIPFNEEVELD